LLAKRRRWESNPLQTGLQPVAWPSGSSVDDARGGIRTHRRPGLSRAARPLAYPGVRGRRKPWDSNPQAVVTAARFQDGSLIRPVGFRRRGVPGAGIEPAASAFRVRRHYQQQLPRIVSATVTRRIVSEIGGQESNLRTPGSRPGISASRNYPRDERKVPCGSRARLSGLEARCLAARPRARPRPSARGSQSGRPDSNRRSPGPEPGGLPSFPTPRNNAEVPSGSRTRTSAMARRYAAATSWARSPTS
jgi:hypothetical protein